MPADDEKPTTDLKVKQLLDNERPLEDVLDAKTAAELERWFGLPSVQEVVERGDVVAEDPDVIAVRERREKAIASVDPELLAAVHRRVERCDTLITFKSVLESRVDPTISNLDLKMIERGSSIADPREVELSEELKDDLKDCTPQALLRDLHRPELEFEKQFDMVDLAAEQRLDIVAEVATAMATNWKLPPLGASPVREASGVIAALRSERKGSWPAMFTAKPLPNRRIED